MSGTLLLAPHNDDEVLFSSWLVLRYRPHVAVCFASAKQDAHVTAVARTVESVEALRLLGATGFEQWPVLDTYSDEAAEAALKIIMEDQVGSYAHVFAPAVEEDGHEQHTLVGSIADAVFGADNVTHYLTYRRGHGRSTSEWEVPFEPLWPSYKLAAMSCYQSQIRIENTLPWFLDGGLREYYAHEPKEIVGDAVVEQFIDKVTPAWAQEDLLRSVL